jgi:hypothetical protein
MAEPQKRLNTFISAQTFKAVKIWAAKREVTLGAAVEELLLCGFGNLPVPIEAKQGAGLSPEKKKSRQSPQRSPKPSPQRSKNLPSPS